ncbi:DPH4 homolog [Aplysia californica]|uniref:DPH4 homolog n=1 Tax=Aplysia californica TaxID=6500 RepID=A0ABM1A7K0_APLCA|nr:DPH4 homolog [Aplysia californica]
MENLYEILQSSPQASAEELKKSYMRLARQYHPDKMSHSRSNGQESLSEPSRCEASNEQSENTFQKNCSDEFVKIDRAWKILRDSELRTQFDLKWQERCLSQDLPIQDTVPYEDFDWDDSEDMYTYPCRCGSFYLLSETDVKLLYDIVCCETCSLTIKVVYS